MTRDKRIILHLGASKCGTTSLQGFLSEQDEAMRAQGILRPACLRSGYNDAIIGAYMGMPPKVQNYMRLKNLDPSQRDTIQSAIAADLLQEVEASACETVLLTFEGFLPRSEEQIEQLMQLLHQISSDVSAIVALRRHDRWAVSSYNTRLVGQGTATADMLMKDRGDHRQNPQPHGIHYAQALKFWGNAVGQDNLTAFAFEDHDNVLVPYLNAIGFRSETKIGPIRNQGLSAYGQEVIRRVNEWHRDETGPDPVAPETARDRKTLRRALKAILPRGTPKRPSAAQVKEHRAYFAGDLEAMRGTYLSADSQFFEDLTPYPETATHVDVSDDEVMDWVVKADALTKAEFRKSRFSYTDEAENWKTMEMISRGKTMGQA